MAEIQRRKTPTVQIGHVRCGWEVPVVVQSMTNTDTADAASTIEQVAALALAGSEIVRITVNNDEAAAAVPAIVEGLDKRGLRVPLVGDFHYNGHLLLKKFPETARALAKYRINPGNVSIGRKDDDNFRTMVECAVKNQKPVRIGVNWGSLDQALLARMMDANQKLAAPKPLREVMLEAMIASALDSAAAAEKYGLRHNQILLSAKVSGVRDLIDLYTELAPNLKGAIIARQVIGPHDMEQELGLIGGNIFHGELSLDQLFHMRPASGYADFRTPLRGLYHASSATHGGGGVCGIPAALAVRQIERDQRRERWRRRILRRGDHDPDLGA